MIIIASQNSDYVYSSIQAIKKPFLDTQQESPSELPALGKLYYM